MAQPSPSLGAFQTRDPKLAACLKTLSAIPHNLVGAGQGIFRWFDKETPFQRGALGKVMFYFHNATKYAGRCADLARAYEEGTADEEFDKLLMEVPGDLGEQLRAKFPEAVMLYERGAIEHFLHIAKQVGNDVEHVHYQRGGKDFVVDRNNSGRFREKHNLG